MNEKNNPFGSSLTGGYIGWGKARVSCGDAWGALFLQRVLAHAEYRNYIKGNIEQQ
jgi:hypothetical protein